MSYTQKDLLSEGIWSALKTVGKATAKTMAPKAYKIADDAVDFGKDVAYAYDPTLKIKKYLKKGGYILQNKITKDGKNYVAPVKKLKYDQNGVNVTKTDPRNETFAIVFNKKGEPLDHHGHEREHSSKTGQNDPQSESDNIQTSPQSKATTIAPVKPMNIPSMPVASKTP